MQARTRYIKSVLSAATFAATLGALVAAPPPAVAAPIFGVIDGPLNMHVNVLSSDLAGNTLHSDAQDVVGTISGPKQSAEILFEDAQLGANPTRLPPNVKNAFASALAESDGNGGVGVAAVKFGGGGEQLVSQASWEQTFEDVNGLDSTISLHMAVPSMIAGLFLVAPNRSAVNKIEQALTEVDLVTTIHRANGAIEAGGAFQFGVRVEEFQIPLGPGIFSNFADISFIGSAGVPLGIDVFNAPTNPVWVLDPFSIDLTLGTLNPGDTLSYTYQLTTRGRTSGAERGFQAFVGDPFGVNITGGNLVATITQGAPADVPEPQTWGIMIVGVGLLARLRRPNRSTLSSYARSTGLATHPLGIITTGGFHLDFSPTYFANDDAPCRTSDPEHRGRSARALRR